MSRYYFVRLVRHHQYSDDPLASLLDGHRDVEFLTKNQHNDLNAFIQFINENPETMNIEPLHLAFTYCALELNDENDYIVSARAVDRDLEQDNCPLTIVEYDYAQDSDALKELRERIREQKEQIKNDALNLFIATQRKSSIVQKNSAHGFFSGGSNYNTFNMITRFLGNYPLNGEKTQKTGDAISAHLFRRLL